MACGVIFFIFLVCDILVTEMNVVFNKITAKQVTRITPVNYN